MMTDLQANDTYKYSPSSLEKRFAGLGNLKSRAKISGKPDRKEDPKLYEVCVKFESLFVKQMLNSMKKTVHKNEFLHGGQAEDLFEDMLYDEYSESMSKNANFGLADLVYRDLLIKKNRSE